MNYKKFIVLAMLTIAGCVKSTVSPEVKIEIRGTPEKPQYYIANTALDTNMLFSILAKGKALEPESFVTIYTTLSDAATSTRELVRLCQTAGYKRIDMRLDRVPALSPERTKKVRPDDYIE